MACIFQQEKILNALFAGVLIMLVSKHRKPSALNVIRHMW